ncbi:hypothetical protein CSUNSWCD_740 [Campylobacter showae CSUNSWCD]|uniref:Uncharacterized protein n=1 Tax=Campylobacter showae CSUNSWCD TaxID=1244083 RepID=M5IPK5_9BACT|nr:hypothetical protein CSUNSWCD_740 [Campylobacter showae CSUNSWCD]
MPEQGELATKQDLYENKVKNHKIYPCKGRYAKKLVLFRFLASIII